MAGETGDSLEAKIDDVIERVGALEAEREQIKANTAAIERLTGAFETFQEIMTGRFDGVDQGVKKASSFETILKFSAGVIVPIVCAYFAMKGAGVR